MVLKFIAKIRDINTKNSLVVGIPKNVAEYEGLKHGDLVQVYLRKKHDEDK